MRLLLSGPFLFGRQGRWGGEGTCACDQGNCRALWNQRKCAAVLRVGWAIGKAKHRKSGGRSRQRKQGQGMKEKTEKGKKGENDER